MIFMFRRICLSSRSHKGIPGVSFNPFILGLFVENSILEKKNFFCCFKLNDPFFVVFINLVPSEG